MFPKYRKKIIHLSFIRLSYKTTTQNIISISKYCTKYLQVILSEYLTLAVSSNLFFSLLQNTVLIIQSTFKNRAIPITATGLKYIKCL
jgi:hypothetical protein